MTRWREFESTYCVTIISARNTGTWAFFSNAVGGFFSNQRESISRCPKSPFPSKTQNRQIAQTSPLMFVRGLADNLRIDAMREHPGTFPEALRAARTAQRNSMMGTGSDHTRQRTPSVGQMPKQQFTARKEKLSDEERTRLLREGRCFRCRGFGHVSRNCPENVPNASRQ